MFECVLFTYTCICMYIYIYVSVYIYMTCLRNLWLKTTKIDVKLNAKVCLNAYCLHIHVYVCMCTYTCISMYVYIYVYVYIYDMLEKLIAMLKTMKIDVKLNAKVFRVCFHMCILIFHEDERYAPTLPS
jgi:hypothetical protein